MPLAIVAGAIANKPGNGGEAWVRLSWLLGLLRLGWDAHLVERLRGEDAAGSRYFEEVVAEFGLAGRASLLGEGGESIVGSDERELAALAAEAELLLDLSGHLGEGPILAAPRRRVYVDLDPGFTQAWHCDPEIDFSVAGYDHWFTVGQNVGRPGCPVPVGGIEWTPTLPPVLLDRWEGAPAPAGPLRLTTVATWRSPYGRLLVDGRSMGLKHHQLRRIAALPELVQGVRLEIALAIHPADSADLDLLRSHGWEVVDPRRAAGTPAAFRDYVRGSGAEFSVAQGVYAEAATGWFSDRTAAYLAAGRPAVVQATGLGGEVAESAALLPFDDLDGAVEAVALVRDQYEARSAASRAFAEKHLDSDRVLGAVLERVGAGGG